MTRTNVGRIIRLMHVGVASDNARPVRRPKPQLESLPAADACMHLLAIAASARARVRTHVPTATGGAGRPLPGIDV
jgi:hypothetical protein